MPIRAVSAVKMIYVKIHSMRVLLPTILVLGMGLSALGGTESRVLRSIAEIKSLTETAFEQERPVELEATVIASLHTGSNGITRLIIQDPTGNFQYEDIAVRPPAVGDIISAKGKTFSEKSNRQHSIHSTDFTVLGHRPPAPPTRITARDISRGTEDFKLVRLSGYVSEVMSDEINPEWLYFILREDGEPIYVAIPLDDAAPEDIFALTDAKVELTGIALPHYGGERLFVGPHLELWSKDCITVLEPAPADPFLSPYLPDIIHVSPNELARMRRHRVEGEVRAAWRGSKMLVEETSGRLIEIELAQEQTLPPCGTRIQAVGFPTTDLFRLKLSRALWRKCGPSGTSGEDAASPLRADSLTACETTAREILLDGNGKKRLNQEFYGKLIRLRGIIRSLPTQTDSNSRLHLDCDGFLVPVDVSASPSVADGLALGCEIAASGVCIMETENWRSDNLFPVFGGFILVPRSAKDILVLARPPWWTPGRLLVVICSLFAALLGILVWNRILNRLVERRSRQLFKEQVAHAGSDLKVDERTRLAVELHDSLSQTLTGVSFQIDAAEKARQRDPSRIEKHLAIAKRTLQSCRDELRNCLWDLRNNALEDADTATAVRRTIEPHIGEAQLALDVQVPRAKLSDNTFHSILCILRELSVNAVRHGAARRIAIAGRLADGALTFSVTDDGSGFDPDNRPGMDEGHFGLQGIAERLDTLGGEMDIASRHGRGTSVTVRIRI